MKLFPGAAQRIRLEMVRCGYTMEQLAETTQISKPVLQGLLNGRAEAVSTRNLFALSRAFGYDTAFFIDLLSRESPYQEPIQEI